MKKYSLAVCALLAACAALPLRAEENDSTADSTSTASGVQAKTAKPVKPEKGPAAEQNMFNYEDFHVKFGVGFDYSTGHYGQAAATDIWYLPFTGTAELDHWTAKVTVPWVSITGPGVVFGAGDTSVTTNTPRSVRHTQGLGDVIGSLAYTIDLPEQVYLDPSVKVKFPTGDRSESLGTGEYDYSLGADIYKQFGKFSVFAGGAHRFTGEENVLRLHGIWLADVGAGYNILPDLNAGVLYGWRESATNLQDPSELTPYLTYNITEKVSAQVYGVTGFSNGSPDYGGGIMLGYTAW